VKKAVGAILKIVHVHDPPSLKDFNTACEANKEIESCISKCKQELLNPLVVFQLFERIPLHVRFYCFTVYNSHFLIYTYMATLKKNQSGEKQKFYSSVAQNNNFLTRKFFKNLVEKSIILILFEGCFS
jgi:hypothetical protein